MTSRPPLAQLAMRALADDAPAPAPPSRREADDAIAAIARAITEAGAKRKRRARLWMGLGGAAAAASLLLAVGALSQRDRPRPTASVDDVKGSVMLVRGEHGVTLGRETKIAEGDRVVASAEGVASLRLQKGTELRLTRGADVAFVEQGAAQIYDLAAGTAHLHVTKLAAGERFLVRTVDAEVEVKGTEFDVDVREPCEGTTTRVAVTEGTVVVRHGGVETRVTVGESWPARCAATAARAPLPTALATPSEALPASTGLAPLAPAPSAPPVASTPTAERVARAPGAANVPPAVAPNAPLPPTTPPPSALSEQNRLFADAMASKRRGDTAGALAALDGLTTAYPQGTLAESAYVEKMRVLTNVDRRRATDAARAYLARFPSGYARDEARALTTP